MNTAPQLSSIGKYRLIANIGHGGMAHIHLALMAGPAGFNKLLVIKALRDDIAGTSEEFLTMFLDEARLAARLSHPNIVQTYEVGEANGRYFIAMEYLEGQSMKTVERRLSPSSLSLPMYLRIISEVAKGLHHAHELKGYSGEPLGVVHRDVSPHNVFLTYEGQIKLLDFGIAKANNAVHLTKVGVIKGKADYIAPEQIRGDEVDLRADIFSLGVMMWEALAGKRFAGGPDVAEITKMHNRLTGGEPKLNEVKPGLPPDLVAICEKALALHPKDRFQSALDFAHEIDDYLADASLHPSARDLAQLISPVFAKEREQLRKLIDEQMRLALDPNATFEANTGQLPSLSRGTFSSGVWVMPQGSQTLTGNTPISLQAGFAQTPSMAFPLAASQAMPASVGAAPPVKKTVPWPMAMGFVVVAVAVGTYLAARPAAEDLNAARGALTQTPRASAAAPTVVAAPREPTIAAPAQKPQEEAPEVESVRVRIAVEPPEAIVTLDGAQLTLPFDGEVVRGRAVHELEVSAPGYRVHREMLTYDRDQDIKVALLREADKKLASRGSSSSTESAPINSAAPTAAPAPAPAAEKPTQLEPGMDFRRIAPGRPAVKDEIVLEEDPYR